MLPTVKDIDNQSLERFISEVIKKDDFVTINGKVEITRDLALKLFHLAKLSYDTQVVSTTVNTQKGETVYVVKAKVYKESEKVAEGLGACSTAEVQGSRVHHDALARAETRAFKRALEACVGLPFINQVIERFFGAYEVEQTTISAEEFVRKIREAKALPHLKNIWEKYKANLNSYSQQDRERVIMEKENKKLEFRRRGEA